MRKFEIKIKKQQSKLNNNIVLNAAVSIVLLMLIHLNIGFAFPVILKSIIPENHAIVSYWSNIAVWLIMLSIYIFIIYKTLANVVSEIQAARILDIHNNDKSDTMQNALELMHEKGENQIVSVILEQADEHSETLSLFKRPIEKQLLTALVMIIVFSTHFMIFPANIKSSINTLLRYRIPENKVVENIQILPGSVEILRGDELEITVVNPMEISEYSLYTKETEIWKKSSMTDGFIELKDSDHSFSYFVRSQYGISDTFRVDVYEKPVIRSINLKMKYPEYMHLDDDEYKNADGNFNVPEGTKVQIEIEANNDLQSADIMWNGGDILKMERIAAKRFSVEFKADRSSSYYFRIMDFLGNQSQRIDYYIKVIKDEIPVAEITYPARDTILSRDMYAGMHFLVSDDFGLNSLKFHFRYLGKKGSRSIQGKIQGITYDTDYLFDGQSLDLGPGDELEYWITVKDNKPSPQTGMSRKYRLRVPSIEEIYQQLEKTEDNLKDSFEDQKKESEEMLNELEKQRRKLMKKENPEWEDKKELEAVLKEQQKIAENIKKLAKEYEKVIDQYEQNESLQKETLDKMEKIKDMMDEVFTDELQEEMRKMQENVFDMNKKDILKSLEKFKFSIEEYNKKLDQTLELLEQLKQEQSLQKSEKMLEELMKQQQELMKDTKEGADKNKLAKRQEELREKLKSLEKQMKDSEDLFSEQDSLSQKMQDELQKLDENKLDEEMKKSSENMKNNQMQKSKQNQQNAMQQMQQMQENLKMMQSMMSGGQMGDIGTVISDSILRFTLLSTLLEDNIKRYDGDPFKIVKEQIAIKEGVEVTLKKLYSIPQSVLFITPKFFTDVARLSEVYHNMFTDINDAKVYNINKYLPELQGILNTMIYDLMQSQASMSSGGGSGSMQSFMQSMQKMSAEQMTMNMMTQQLFDQLSDSGMSSQQRKQLQEMAGNEQRMAENMKRMLQTEGEAQKQADAMQQLIDELEEISRQMRYRKVDRELIERQSKIVSKMLDIQKSINKRETSKKRRAERSNKDWTVPEHVLEKFNSMKQKAQLYRNLSDYPEEYQEVIQEYIRQLNKESQGGDK